MFMLSSGSGDDDHGDDNDQIQKKKMVFKVHDLGFDFFPFYNDYLLEEDGTLRMVGSCNGIICLHDPEVMDEIRGCTRQHYSNLRDVCLWNPATRQFRILPKSIPIEEKWDGMYGGPFDFVAFGFDVETKDHKVLRITPLRDRTEEGGCMCRVQVYSLSTDSWRLLEDINSLPADIPDENHGIYLNSSYFFVGDKSNNEFCDFVLLSFDFTKEIFTTMQLPDDNNSSSSSSVLGCVGEKLAVFTRTGIDDDDDDDCDDGGYDDYDIWVLNEQQGGGGVNKESWTKLDSFQIVKTSKSSRGSNRTEPICISNNGEFALLSTSIENVDAGYTTKLQLFNLITKEVKQDFTFGTWQCRAYVYEESLVSIMGGGNDDVLLRWQLPTHGTTYKLNLDAPFISPYFRFGIGLCLTSDTGGCIGVRSLQRYVRDAEIGEALAILEALKWAKKLERSPIIIESDSKNVVSFFMEDGDEDNNSTYWSSDALTLLSEAKFLLNSSELGIISFQYCSRSSNYVADIAAKLGREGLGLSCKEWTANSPGEIVMSLIKDLSIETSS